MLPARTRPIFWRQHLHRALDQKHIANRGQGEARPDRVLLAGLEELASSMGPTPGPNDRICTGCRVVSAGAVGQQRALEALQKVRRMGSSGASRVAFITTWVPSV